MTIAHLYQLSSQASGLAWVLICVFFAPSLLRILLPTRVSLAVPALLGPVRYYDPIKALIVIGSFKNIGFTFLGWVYHRATDGVDVSELLGRTVLYLLSVAIAVVLVLVIRYYERDRA